MMELKDHCNNLTAIANHCKNSTSPVSVQVPSYNIPLKFRVLQIIIASVILVASVTFNSLLLIHLKKRREDARQHRPPATDTLISNISVVSIVVVLIGMNFFSLGSCHFLCWGQRWKNFLDKQESILAPFIKFNKI